MDIKFHWNEEKNLLLIEERSISFNDIVSEIYNGNLLANLPHPTRFNQFIFVVEFEEYAYAVPYVKKGETVFLKTIYPDRKLTKRYLS